MSVQTIYRLPIDQISDILKFLPDKTCAEIITGTVMRQLKWKQLKPVETLTLSRISQEKIIPVGALLYQGSRDATVWASGSIGWYTTGTPSQLNYAGACPEERGYVHQFRVKREIRVASHNQMLNYIFFTSDLVTEWDICKKYDGLSVDNGSDETLDELAVCNPLEYLEYTNSLRCADSKNFVVGGIKLPELLGSVVAAPSVSSRKMSHRLRLVPKSSGLLAIDPEDSVASTVSRAASIAVSRTGSDFGASRAGTKIANDPWEAFDGPVGGVLYFTIILDQRATNEIGKWCLDKINQEGNWKIREILVTSEEDCKQYLAEANAIRKKKSANPTVPVPCDRFTLPIIFWDTYLHDNLINRKLVGGYTELIEFLGYINKVNET